MAKPQAPAHDTTPPHAAVAPLALLLALTGASRASAAPAPLRAAAPPQGQTAAPAGMGLPATPAGQERRRLSGVPWVFAQGGSGPVELDTNVGGPAGGDGGPLVVGGRSFPHGLGTAPASLVLYDLRGEAISFSTWMGIDDSAGASGSVVFQVVADGVLLFDSGTRTGSDSALFSGWLPVVGVRELRLVVTDAGDGRTGDLADWGAPVLRTAPRASPGGDGTALAHTLGRWDAPLAWPVTAIHAALLPNGELLSHAGLSGTGPGADPPGDPHGSTIVDRAIPGPWSHANSDHPLTEVFGSGEALRPDGTLLTAGAHGGRDGSGQPIGKRQASRYDPLADAWLPVQDMGQARWGASLLTLGAGDTLAMGGTNSSGNAFRPEVFDGCDWRTLAGVDTAGWLSNGEPEYDHTWPFLHLASDGRVFQSGWDRDMGFVDPTGNGLWLGTFQRESIQRVFGTTALFEPDHVLIVGGVDHSGSFGTAHASAVEVDFSGATPTVTGAGDLFFARADATATLLANGSVLVHGGAYRHATGAEPSQVRVPEIYDPGSGTWRVAAASEHPRGYLSTALLLPDGRVWSGGGTCGAGCASGETAEVFSPPYLFDPTAPGQLAARPAILSAPPSAVYGSVLSVTMDAAATIDRVTLIRTGASGHGRNLEQRFLELDFTQAGANLSVDAPANGNLAPPGTYLLFALNVNGVPSEASFLQLSGPAPTTWQTLASNDGSQAVARHEAAMVEVGGKLYLMGGRGSRPVQEYDPATGNWTNLGNPPLQVHHFQPVVHDGLVWVVGAFVGGFPNETPVPDIYIYDPSDNSWTVGPPMPVGRNRGSSGTVAYEGKFYVVGGNTMGHNGGYVPWFDEFDPDTGVWTALPDAPNARDHFLATVVGTKLVAAGGRRTDLPNAFDNTIAAVDVFDFSTGQWDGGADDIPTERAGTMAAAVGGYAVVIGGESASMNQAHDEVEALEVLTGEWFTLPPLVEDRHSGGVALHAGRLYVVSGSGARGGSPELTTLEILGVEDALSGLTSNLVSNGDFGAGLAPWVDQGNLNLSPIGGVKAPSLSVRLGDAIQTVPATPGNTYSLTALCRASRGPGNAGIAIEFLDSGGGVLGDATSTLPGTPDLTTLETSAVSPAGTTQVRVRLFASQVRVLIVDDVTLVAD